MANPELQRSILSLKSWLFTPATKPNRFGRAAEVGADALIIDLEDAVAPPAKKEARATALRYLAQLSGDHFPCALRINSPDTKFGLDDLQDLLISGARHYYLVLPK
jgi:(S)-citramalyl-CoA lyase